MKISARTLQNMFDMARDHYTQDTPIGLDNQQFMARCYLLAAASLLQVKEPLEFPEEKLVLPAED